ncbi:hypothetical protein BC830DRAFT_1121974 [Chytriomyces sp. MP71]|nr:hypothetical protein BC830DRAFT_1121974 [Chytriomyces sp. MP71]
MRSVSCFPKLYIFQTRFSVDNFRHFGRPVIRYQRFHLAPSFHNQIIHPHSTVDRNVQTSSESVTNPSTLPNWSTQELDLAEEQITIIVSHFEDDVSVVQSDSQRGRAGTPFAEPVSTILHAPENEFSASIPPKPPPPLVTPVVSHASLPTAHHHPSGCSQNLMNPTPSPTRRTTPSLSFNLFDPAIVSRQTNFVAQDQQALYIGNATFELMASTHPTRILPYQSQGWLHRASYPDVRIMLRITFTQSLMSSSYKMSLPHQTHSSRRPCILFLIFKDPDTILQNFACAQKAQSLHHYAPHPNTVYLPPQLTSHHNHSHYHLHCVLRLHCSTFQTIPPNDRGFQASHAARQASMHPAPRQQQKGAKMHGRACAG